MNRVDTVESQRELSVVNPGVEGHISSSMWQLTALLFLVPFVSRRDIDDICQMHA